MQTINGFEVRIRQEMATIHLGHYLKTAFSGVHETKHIKTVKRVLYQNKIALMLTLLLLFVSGQVHCPTQYCICLCGRLIYIFEPRSSGKNLTTPTVPVLHDIPHCLDNRLTDDGLTRCKYF
jgi:hypothetical protein